MYNLLQINGTDFPTPEGSFSITYEDKTNDYESDDGQTTVEVIRADVAKISVSYKGLPEAKVVSLLAQLKTVSTVLFLRRGTLQGTQMKVSNVKTDKVWYKNGVSAWALSFDLQEI